MSPFSKGSGITHLIVFLGNPGAQYEHTRHNAGFMAGDAMASRKNVKITRAQFKALTGTCTIGGKKVMLLKPQTYMNLSGEAVKAAADYYKISPENIIVISDEMSLPLGSTRVRTGGSAGGHNGLKNIIACLGTDRFPRIRIGVGSPENPEYDIKDWVLSKFTGPELEKMLTAASLAAEAAECYITDGPEKAMNLYNRRQAE